MKWLPIEENNGTIDMQDEELVCEMARIGNITNELEMHVRYKERLGQGIPHIHIWDSNSSGGQKHVCIRLNDARYFKHDSATDELNARERAALVKFFKSKPEDFPEIENNFRLAIRMWNANNSSSKIDPNIPMPDYTVIANE